MYSSNFSENANESLSITMRFMVLSTAILSSYLTRRSAAAAAFVKRLPLASIGSNSNSNNRNINGKNFAFGQAPEQTRTGTGTRMMLQPSEQTSTEGSNETSTCPPPEQTCNETTNETMMVQQTDTFQQITTQTRAWPPARREEDRVVLAGKSTGNNLRQGKLSEEPLLDPPVAIPDPYGWMRDEDRSNPEVLKHLNEENAYTESLTKHLEDLRGKIYNEMLSSIQETDYTVPRPRGDWWYYTRSFEGKAYTVHCRAPKGTAEPMVNWDGTAASPILPGEEVILDVNKLAEGKNYCSTGRVVASPSHELLAYTVDFQGGETCQLFVMNLQTGETVDHNETLEVDGSVLFGADDSTLFYIKMDDAHRPFQVYRRRLDNGDEDEMIFEENDALFWTHMYKSLDKKYLFVESSSKETSEIHFLDLTDPCAKLECIATRRKKVLYDVEHRNGNWLISSNVNGTPNMRFMTCPATAESSEEWKEVVDPSTGKPLFDGGLERSLTSITPFAKHVVAEGREGGIPRVWVISYDDVDEVKKFEQLTFEESAHDVGLGSHSEFDTDKILVSYDSLVTPLQHIEVSMKDNSLRSVLKEKSVPGYDKVNYACDRITVQSRDGKTEIPVSLVYRKDVMEKHLESGEKVHTHLYGYGSYGACCEADFRATRLSLIDRGIVYVIAHVRGGGEMGRQWYEEPDGAKYLCKKNTFNDFVDVARWLIDDKNLTSPDRLSCEGRSAGGLLIGASINQAPELFKMALLGVPFVDVACTMVDSTIPLTVVEWEEWGNPNEQKYHEYMMEYSPINNVKNAKYPSCLLTGGLHDPRVQYWEPAKFAAELRHGASESSGPVCVKMDMSAGHFSASDRYKYLKELSFDYAFLLDQLGLADSVNLKN